jgi:hypothetical protein
MRLRNIRSVEKSLLLLVAIGVVWFGFIKQGLLPHPGPPIDPLTPLIFCAAIFVIYCLLGWLYILLVRGWIIWAGLLDSQ